MKRLISLLLALACVFGGLVGCGDASSDQNAPANTLSKEDKLMEAAWAYAITMLNLPNASCILGNQLSAYRLEAGKLEMIDYEKYPVFVEDKVVAFATCAVSDTGEYIAGCGAKFADSFWKECSGRPGEAVAIVYAQDGVYLVRQGEAPVLLHEMPIQGCDPIRELDNCRSSLVYSMIR